MSRPKAYVLASRTDREPSAAMPMALVSDDERMHAAVVYRLDTLSSTAPGPVLVVGYGNPMKATVKAASRAGVDDLWVTGTEDKRRGFSCSGTAQVVSLAAAFDPRLFSNDHALIEAVHACGARVVLWADSATAPSTLFRQLLCGQDVVLLAPLPSDKSLATWVAFGRIPGHDVALPVEWRTCPKCRLSHEAGEVLAAQGVCPTCGELYRLDSDERIALTFDPDTFEEWDAVLEEPDPLSFPEYASTIERQRVRSGKAEAVRTGTARLAGMDVALGVMESTFMMGSMGSVVGEKITRMVERATASRLPVVIFTASGGARMQEGLASLMQMAKISAAIEAHGRAGLPYFSVITDPTTGGVTASFAMEGDVIISEPHALIGFAGRRVIQDTIKQTLPDDFQTAEFALEHGLIDAIVSRGELRQTLAELLALHASRCGSEHGSDGSFATFASVLHSRVQMSAAASGEDERPRQGLFARRAERRGIRKALRRAGVADAPSVAPWEKTPRAAREGANPAWESVQLARNVHRPTAKRYIDAMVDGFIELHGDRAFGDDGAIIAGIGWIQGRAVTVIAQEKGWNLQQRIKRNFGCPQPEGYRKALRLMRQAQKFGRPVVCLVDTQGAFCGKEAEERGVGNALADNLVELAGLTVPVVSVVLGEGGSGGALALALGNRVAMQEHAVYSVLSPEGFASILWKDRSRAAEAAAVMKMSAAEACELGIIEQVISEGPAPAHENPDSAARNVEDFIVSALDELCPLSGDELRAQRYERFRAF